MRIAILIDAWLPFLGGGQKSVLEITKIFREKYKIKVVIFHGFSSHIFFRSLWTIYVIPQVLFYHLFFKRFDLIDARPYIAGLPGKMISLILKIPIVYTVGGSCNLDQKNRGFMSWLEKILLTRIKYTQQISDSQHFLKYKNVNKNIIVIPNGVNIEDFEAVKIKKNKKFTLIFVGRLAKIKGLNYLFKAIKVVIKKRQNILLKIIGKGEEEFNLKKQVKADKLEKWIKFLGQLTGKELIKEYKSSYLFILPSLAEGQPITLLEAWAAKLPVLTTQVGSLIYYVNSHNGYIVPPANIKKLAKAIIDAMENKNLKKMAENGFLLVKKRYTWAKAAESYFSVYKKFLAH